MGIRRLDSILNELQEQSFRYFLGEYNPANGLVPDNTRRGAPVNSAGVGLALTAYAVGVERGFMTRREARRRTRTILRFFAGSAQHDGPEATGYQGFYYRFLDPASGRRTWRSELSTVDTALLLAGMLTAAEFYNGDAADEREIRDRAHALYERVNWRWACRRGAAVSHGWRPGHGFLPYDWKGYNEGLLIYLLGLGAPRQALPAASYPAWTRTYRWRRIYDREYLYAGPLFLHHLAHLWVDLRGIQDLYMRGKGIDYFENSRRATYVQQRYAIRNPRGFAGYGEHCWGLTASDGPGFCRRRVGGRSRRFYGYCARGVPYGPDDGTIAPWAALTSLPFAPEIVVPTAHHFRKMLRRRRGRYGFDTTFNQTFPGRGGWVNPHYYALSQGPLVIMIENHRSELIWRLMRRCQPLLTGLRRAGFRGGWLSR